MIIRKMRASFGCLAGEELTLHDGLNIIEAGNERGKSTWCAFIRCMLYGVDSSQRARGGEKPDKQLYAPWSGAPMEGEMELRYGGDELRLRRATKQAAAPMRSFSAVSIASGEELRFLNTRDAGETLVGAEEDVFERTAFIRGGAMSVRSSAELERRMTALLSTGAEGCSYSEAEARLRAWQRQRRFRGRGHLPELETELAELNARLHAIEKATTSLEAMEERGEGLMRERERQRREQTRRLSERREELLGALAQAREGAGAREAQAAKALDQAQRLQETQEAGVLYGVPPEELAAREEQAEALLRRAAPRRFWWAALILAAAAGIVFFALSRVAALFIAAAAVGTALWDILRAAAGKRSAAQAERLLAPYGAADPAALRELREGYDRQEQALDAARTRVRQTRELADKAGEGLRALEAQLLSVSAAAPPAELLRTEAALERLRSECAMARGELNAMGDTLVLESRVLSLDEQRLQEERACRALDMALESLRDADEELQGCFLPALTARTAALMGRLTGGKYSEITLTRELEAMVRRQGDAVLRESAYLSRGTWDQLYLALRLALSELALPGEERCPLILDDALTAFDDERLGLALELLEELARERQILLFTCQSRESRYLRKRGGKG